MPVFTSRRREFAGLNRRARSDVRRLAWHFAQRHWTLHAPAFGWLVFVLLHTQYAFVADARHYAYLTVAFFALAVIVIRLHIAHYLRPARAIYDLLGAASVRMIVAARR